MSRKMPRRVLAAVAAMFVLPTMLPQLASAQAVDMRRAGEWQYELPDDLNENADIPPGVLIMNAPGRTAFQLFSLNGAKTFLRTINLDSLRVVNEVTLTEPLITSRGTAIAQHIHGLDPDKNILYLPYSERSFFAGILAIDGATGAVLHKFPRIGANDPTQAASVRNVPPNGPQDVVACTSAACLPQTFGGSPSLAGMEFIPSYVSGSKDKLLMLWTEPMGPGLEGNLYVSWATQWDAGTGQQDFSYRIQSCSVRYPTNTYSQYALTIFQARLGAGIYVGCNAQGNTGQVVRIRLDSNGQPSGEDAYPGPISVADVLADRQTDRLVFRVATPKGESFWVFNGTSSNYTGVVSTTLNAVPTMAGMNEANGRFYVMAPGSSRGSQSQRSALLTTELRRSPTPQVTMYPDLFVDAVDMLMVVDTNHPSGNARLFVHRAETTYFTIIEDTLPASEDEGLTDLDRFTVDVEEAEGVTAANFTGTGHAYGLRTLFAGGLQGAVPIGVDASGITIRFAASQLNSACMTQDREVALGSIPFANIAGNLTSAEAAASTADSGSISDLREPSGRCHPRPFPGALPEPPRFLPDDPDHDGQSQGDEILGTEWPFYKAQCSGQSSDEQVTTLRPLDRDPVPDTVTKTTTGTAADALLEHPRQTSQPLEDNRAAVLCGQLEQRVDASAVASAMLVSDLPPGIGSLEIGSVGSFTNLYRTKDRGLVAETVAYVRDINIGDRISIDLAYSKATAWAAGRPGTAGTTLDRRVCGVSIPEISGRYSVIPIDSPSGPLPPDPDPVEVGDPLWDNTQGVENPVDGGDGISYPIGTVDPLNYGDDDQNIEGAINACSEIPTQASAANGTPLGSTPFLEAINRVLGARGKASIPEPDRELRQGSPGGYLASIQKDRYQQIGSRAVSNDGSTQVPALEIQLYGDDPTQGRGRQLFQFAGVDASVTYGLYLLNPEYQTPIDTPGDDLPPWDITDDLVPLTGGPELPPVYPQPPTAPRPPTSVFTPVTYVFKGAVFLARSWQDAGLATGVMVLLAGPAILLGRRRGLRSLI